MISRVILLMSYAVINNRRKRYWEAPEGLWEVFLQVDLVHIGEVIMNRNLWMIGNLPMLLKDGGISPTQNASWIKVAI